MEKLHRLSQGSWRDIAFGSIAVLVIIADQLTKWWIKSTLALGETWADWGFLEIIHVQNTGVSFGLFKGYLWLIVTAVFIEIIIILFIVYLLRNRLSFMDNMLLRTGIGLIMGGALGNQIDRLAMGYVTDFINFKIWPAFNVADMSAVTGTIIVAFCILFKSGLTKLKDEQKR